MVTIGLGKAVTGQVSGGRIIVSELYRKAGIEPPLHELMADDVILAVMRRDNLSLETVWAHVNAAQARLRDRELRKPEYALPPLRKCA